MATKTADNLLKDIQTETLQNLLSSVLFQISPLGCTNIDALDAHFFSTSKHRPPGLVSLNRGDVVEIQGPPSSGKTHLMYHLIITCITPSSYRNFELHGWSRAAIVIDTDGTFDIHRLRQLLDTHLTRLIPSNPRGTIEDLSRLALEKLHVFSPTSSTQLAATLMYLPAYHTAQLPDDEIGLLAIDSINSFYWLDRFTAEQIRSMPPPSDSGAGKPPPGPAHLAQHVLTTLQNFRRSHTPVVALTNWVVDPPSGHDSQNRAHPAYSSAFAAPSTNSDQLSLSSTHHIALSRLPFTQFETNIFREEPQVQEEHYRKMMVKKGKVGGIVRTVGSTRLSQFVSHIGEKNIVF